MAKLGLHIFFRTGIAFLAVLSVLTGIVWVTQALRRFDLVTAKGQAIVDYLAMTLLALPFLVGLVAPFALVLAMVVVLNALHADSELVAANAAGASHRQILAPFALLALIVTALVAWITLLAAPQALQALRDRTNRVRADVVANVLQPGRFIDIDDDLTFHIKNRAGDGSLQGIFIYDARDPAFLYTYSAEVGRVVEAVGRTLVVMERGTVERQSRVDDASTYVAFGSYAFDLTALQAGGPPSPYKVDERTMPQLIGTPADDPYRIRRADQFRAEIHSRFAALVYPMLMTLAVFLFLGFPKTTRTGRAGAIVAALVVAAVLRIAGFALAGIAAGSPATMPLVYAVPAALLLVVGGSVLFGIQPFVPGPIARPFAALVEAVEAAIERRRGAAEGGR